MNWTDLYLTAVSELRCAVNSRIRMHEIYTVLLQPINMKYSRNADAHDQWTRRSFRFDLFMSLY